MTAENKKIALYAGGALFLGAVSYFVYEFFKKPKNIDLGSTQITLGEEQNNIPTEGQNATQPNAFTQYTQTNIKPLDLKFQSINDLFKSK